MQNEASRAEINRMNMLKVEKKLQKRGKGRREDDTASKLLAATDRPGDSDDEVRSMLSDESGKSMKDSDENPTERSEEHIIAYGGK